MIILDEAALTPEFNKALDPSLRIVVSDAAVDESSLSPGEKLRASEFAGLPRRLAWLRGRAALKRLLSGWQLGNDTAALSFPHPRFSLTHSGNYAVAIGTTSRELVGIGIDFEITRFLRRGSARFFLTDGEQAWLRPLGESAVQSSLIRLWTIKEAVFKADPENRKTGLIDYEIEHPGEWTGTAFLRADTDKVFLYSCLQVHEGFLSVGILPRRNRNA
jgi:4'-phosphopantetheinyl transferase EntD